MADCIKIRGLDRDVGFAYDRGMIPKDNKLRNNLSRQLKQVRSQLNLSQEEMGRILGLQRSAYGKLERGDNLPGARMLYLLAVKCGISIDALLLGRGAPLQTKKGAPLNEEAEMISLMRQVPMVRHAMISHFQRFRLENRDLIDAELEKTKNQS